MRHAGFFLLALLPALSVPRPLAAEEVVAIRAGRIIPIDGEEIRNGVVLIQGDRIEAVGKDVEVPWDARVIDAADQVVMPGLIEPHSSRGLDRANESVPNVPFVSVQDSIDPLSSYFEDSLRDGVTTILITPGNSTMIGGQAMAVKPKGETVEEMTVKANVGLKVSLQPVGGRSRMAHIAELRKVLRELQDEMKEAKKKEEEERGKDKEKKEEAPRDRVGEKKKTLVDLLEGRIPAFVYCETPSDVMRAIALSKEFGFRFVPVLGRDGHKAAGLLAKAKLPAVLDPTLVDWERDDDTGEEKPYATPTILRDEGVKFALQSTSSTLGNRFLWYQAALAVRYGLSREEALRSITLSAAEVIGMGDRIGSLEAGKQANLLILSGDPLDVRTWVDTVMIEGKVVYERSKDSTLENVGR